LKVGVLLFIINGAKENDCRINQCNTNPLKIFTTCVLLVSHMDENLPERFLLI
jgi:hypothetical protein